MPESHPEETVNLELVATALETATALADRAGRKSGSTPCRRSFVQSVTKDLQANGAPLAKLVKNRDHRALLLYLMVLTVSSKEPWNVCEDAKIWARILSLGKDRASLAAVSKALGRLKTQNLITVERRGRRSDIILLREDGSEEPYTYPDPDLEDDRYLKLPLKFWTEGWFEELEIPGLAMLLVLLAEKDDALLPSARIPDWYGISESTAKRGFKELEENGLLTHRKVQLKTPLAPDGYTISKHYRLAGDFKRTPTKLEFESVEEPLTKSQKRRIRRRNRPTQRKERTT